MGTRFGTAVSIVACLLYLVVLGWPYAVKSVYDVNTYYGSGVVNPLFVGVLVAVVLVVVGAVRENYVSAQVGAGIVLGFGLFTVLLTTLWAVTVRLDVFRAPGWALPAQRFALVGLSTLIVFGVVWYTLANDLVSLTR